MKTCVQVRDSNWVKYIYCCILRVKFQQILKKKSYIIATVVWCFHKIEHKKIKKKSPDMLQFVIWTFYDGYCFFRFSLYLWLIWQCYVGCSNISVKGSNEHISGIVNVLATDWPNDSSIRLLCACSSQKSAH